MGDMNRRLTRSQWACLRVLGIALLMILFVPACNPPAASSGSEESSKVGAEALTSQLVWPTTGTVTQNTHPYPGHPGIDIGAVVGTPVYAAADGEVVSPYDDPGGYGCNVVINHTGGGSLFQGTISIYGHLSGIVVTPGTQLNQGALIGHPGGAAGAACSGNATGPHLHFELRLDGVAIRGWDSSVGVGAHVNALDGISTHIDGLPDGGNCEAACGNYGCHCVDGQCSGGFCAGTGCTAQETANCGAYGVNCVDHQCSGGFGPGTGCTARETLDCGNYGVNCVDHQCSGGFGPGTGCTARETLDCGNYGVNCVDHQCSGGFGPGSGCTAHETIDCQAYGCGCADHKCGGGFCPGTGCTAHETGVCDASGKTCALGACTP